MFDTYLAFDPSLWWNKEKLVHEASDRLRAKRGNTTIYLANSSEPGLADVTQRMAKLLETGKFPGVKWYYDPMPAELHSTIYHPAALEGFSHALQAATGEVATICFDSSSTRSMRTETNSSNPGARDES